MSYEPYNHDIIEMKDIMLRKKEICPYDNITPVEIIEDPVIMVESLHWYYAHAIADDCFGIFWIIQDLIYNKKISTDVVRICILDNMFKSHPKLYLELINTEKKEYISYLNDIIKLLTPFPIIFQHLSDTDYLFKQCFKYECKDIQRWQRSPFNCEYYNKNRTIKIDAVRYSDDIIYSMLNKFRAHVFNKVAVMNLSQNTNEMIIIDGKKNCKIDDNKLQYMKDEANRNTCWYFRGVVYLEDLTFSEQVHLFNRTRIIILRSSSCYKTNLLWAQQNSIIFELESGSHEISSIDRVCKLSNSKNIMLDYNLFDPKVNIFDFLKRNKLNRYADLKINKKYFITFASGEKKYIEAGERLITQAKNLELFDKCIFYTDTYLQKDLYFWAKHGDFIKNNNRGYGFWLWKIYIVKLTMENMNDGDILVYLDAGCEIDIRKKKYIQEYFNFVKYEEMLFTTTNWHECQYNKMDTLIELDANSDFYINSYQRQAGVVMYLICDRTRDLVNKWYEMACNYHLLDDSSSIHQNNPKFKEHRHDQAIFSILSKKYNFNCARSLYPIFEVYRNISGISKIIK